MQMHVYTKGRKIYTGSPQPFRVVIRDENTEREYLLIPASRQPKMCIEKSREVKLPASPEASG